MKKSYERSGGVPWEDEEGEKVYTSFNLVKPCCSDNEVGDVNVQGEDCCYTPC
jgi:hypothetical protein